MAKTSKPSGKKGSTPVKAPIATKKPKATTAAESTAPVAAAATKSTSAAAVAAATKGKATRPSASQKPGTPTVITSEERHRLIAEAAYLIAEKRGFQGGSPEQDWYDAVAQIDQMIMGTNRGSGT